MASKSEPAVTTWKRADMLARMSAPGRARGKLLAVSDLHVGHPDNRSIVERLRPDTDEDWLIVCGDVSDTVADVEWALGLLSRRFATVIWTPGNHELWSPPEDCLKLRGEPRYQHLVDVCRGIGVLTPEDPYAIWEGEGGPAIVAPLFLLYDYSFGRNIAPTKAESLALAHRAGVVCSDEFLLHPDPYASRDAWCNARISITEERLAAHDPDIPMVMVNHFPLTEGPTKVLLHPEFAQWCGTVRTCDWHRRFRTAVVVYGHLHIPRTTWQDGVRFEEVSLGYPREWQRRRATPVPRQVMPAPESR